MATGAGMGECCLSGSIHSGQTRGRVEEIGGLSTYISEPEGESRAKSIVFLTDVFGYTFNNTRLLADEYAKAGFYVYVPDILNGDPIYEGFLQDVEPALKDRDSITTAEKAVKTAKVGATLGPWLVTHREAVTKPIIDGFLNHVRTVPGTDKIGTIGFCFGGRYAILTAHGQADAAYACHPSLTAIPEDLEPVTKPLSLAVGEKDSLLPESEVEKIKDALAKKSDVPTEVKVYKDQIHGFALRSDWSSEADKKAMDDAEKQGVEWFKKYLS